MDGPVMHIFSEPTPSDLPIPAPDIPITAEQRDLLSALAVERLTPLPVGSADPRCQQQVRRLRRLARAISVAQRGGQTAITSPAEWSAMPAQTLADHLRRLSRWADATWATQPHLPPARCQELRSLGYSARYVADQMAPPPAHQGNA